MLDSDVPLTGSILQLYNLSRAWQKAGVEVIYLTTTRNECLPSEEEYEGLRVLRCHIPKRQMIYSGKSLPKVMDIIHAVSPDVIYLRGRSDLQLVAGQYCKTHNCRVVWGTNGEDSLEWWRQCTRLWRSRRSLFSKLVLFPFAFYNDLRIHKGMKMADVVVNQTEHQQKRTLEQLGKNGVLLPNYLLPPDEKQNTERNSILWMATVSPTKQPDVFLMIVEDLQKRLPHIKFHLVGKSNDANYFASLSEKAQRLGVEMPGFCDYNGTWNYYQNACIFISTSLREGLPNSFIQAWQMGTPVFSLNIDPNGWLAQKSIGFCSQGDLTLLEDKIVETVMNKDEWQKMSLNASTFAKKTFSNPNIIKSYLEVFQG